MSLISRQAAIAEFSCCELTPDCGIDANYVIDFLEQMPSAPHVMTYEEVAQMLSNIFDECACDVNGNDEWLPQSCKYAETDCPSPKEKNGCWMQFLIQGGADMRGEEE